jgi:hypothetical protein
MERVLPANREFWEGQLSALLPELGRSGVKVLLLDQPVAGIPPEVYRRIVRRYPNADFLSVKETLEDAAASLPAPLPDPDWMSEFPEAFRRYFRHRVPYYGYLGSILHINARGHRELARALETWVEKHGMP